METGTVKGVEFKIVYEGRDVSGDIAPRVISIEYIDTVEGESSSLEITLENVDQDWNNSWYPNKGDKIEAEIGGLECGKFTLDEVVLAGPPDIVRLVFLENMVTKVATNTKKSKSHESKSLRQIAEHVARANNLKLIGNVPSISFNRVSQHRETDIKFLRRISYQFGIIFSVRDDKLIFTSLKDVDAKQPIASFAKSQLISYELKDKTFNTLKAVKVSYHDPKEKQNVTHTVNSYEVKTLKNADGLNYTQIVSADTKVIHRRVENKQQAEMIAQSELYRSNTLQQSGSITIEGNALIVSGVNIELTELGTAGSGVWNIRKATHSLDVSQGWTVSVDIKRLALIAAEKTLERISSTGKKSDGDMFDSNPSSYGKYDGDRAYENKNNIDITREKKQIQSSLRFIVDRRETNTYIYPTDGNLAKRNIKIALSSMEAKGGKETAEAIEVRLRHLGRLFDNNPKGEYHEEAAELAELLIGDIPSM